MRLRGWELDPPRVRRASAAPVRWWRGHRAGLALGAAGLALVRAPRACAIAARAHSATTSRPRSTSARRTSCAPPRRSPARRSRRATRSSCSINGDRIFPAFLETIASAERTLNVQTYVYWRGEIAEQVAAAIRDKAREGVRCNVILDALGAAQMERSQIGEMRDAGANVVLFRPPKPYAIKRVANRTHRRALIADGKVGMTGGVGIAAEWMGDAEDSEHWRDSHVRVRGPVVRGLQGAFAENWLEATGEVLAGEDYLPDLEPVEGGATMQLVRSSATVGDTNAEALYYLAIASARREIELTAAYFVPRPAFTDALISAAERGVRVRILVPGPHIDKGFVRTAGRAAYEKLLDAGVELHEFQPTMLHAKSLSVDGSWSSVGTINFDNRSFQLHDEVTLCVWDEGFAGALGEAFENDLERSMKLEPGRWKRRGPVQRAAETATTVMRREL